MGSGRAWSGEPCTGCQHPAGRISAQPEPCTGCQHPAGGISALPEPSSGRSPHPASDPLPSPTHHHLHLPRRFLTNYCSCIFAKILLVVFYIHLNLLLQRFKKREKKRILFMSSSYIDFVSAVVFVYYRINYFSLKILLFAKILLCC